MRALLCPQCGAPLKPSAAECPYCGVGLQELAGTPGAKTTSAPARQKHSIPTGWLNHLDPWHGFQIAHPQGWHVETFRGAISIRLDPAGLTSAWVWPFNLPSSMSAVQVSQYFVNLNQTGNPSFQAWVQANASPHSNRISLRTRMNKYGRPVEGIWNILVMGNSANISGYTAEAGKIAESSEIFAGILSSFEPVEMMPRQVASDPTEGAFTLQLPVGWVFQGGVNRQNTIGGAANPYFSSADSPAGSVAACMPNYTWFFIEPGLGGFFNMTGGYQSMPYCHAVQLSQQKIIPWMGSFQSGMQVISLLDRPDLADLALADLARSGYLPGSFEATCAIIETTYTENNTRYRQVSRVFTQCERANAGIFTNTSPGWVALLDMYYRAPVDQFNALMPVLSGIIDTYTLNPQWQAAEQQRTNGILLQGQMERNQRLSQISRTLSETSDIITKGYWDRQAVYDRLSEMRQNASLGVQNVAGQSGDVYKVPYGYDQYWRDGLGNFYAGSWSDQPEIHWVPLKPTGI